MTLVDNSSWEVSLIGLSLTAFAMANILTKPYKHSADWLLCIWLVLLNMPLLNTVLHQYHVSFTTSKLYLVSNPMFHLLNGPILYLYIRMLMSREKSMLRASEWGHFIPFVFFYLLFILISPGQPMTPYPSGDNFDFVADRGLISFFQPLLYYFGVINVLIFLGYSVVSIYTLWRHQKSIESIFSQNDNQVSLKWIYALPSVFIVLVIFNIVNESAFESDIMVHPQTLHLSSYFSFILLLCFFGVKQKPIFELKTLPLNHSKMVIENRVEDRFKTDEKSKKGNVASDHPMSDEFIAQAVTRIQSYMQSKKPYLNPDFSVYMLADDLGLPRRTLTSILNIGFSKNFYQYVNEFRIEEVKAQLECQENTSTILDIAFWAGFKSKSSFNSLFKQHCHVTPSQYRKGVKSQKASDSEFT